MAYTAPPSAKSAGDPVEATDFNNYRDNIIDHETRITSLASGAAKIQLLTDTHHNLLQYSPATGDMTGVDFYQAQQDFTITSAILTDIDGATSGTIEFDVLKSTTIGGSYTTIFSTKPSVSASGSPAESSNAVISVSSVSSGDWLRLDITSLATGTKSIRIEVTANV